VNIFDKNIIKNKKYYILILKKKKKKKKKLGVVRNHPRGGRTTPGGGRTKTFRGWSATPKPPPKLLRGGSATPKYGWGGRATPQSEPLLKKKIFSFNFFFFKNKNIIFYIIF
jgi:hypothetical protein